MRPARLGTAAVTSIGVENPAGSARSATAGAAARRRPRVQRAAKLRVERATDRAAAGPVAAIGDDGAQRLRGRMQPWVDRIVEAGVVGAWKLREELWKDLPEP